MNDAQADFLDSHTDGLRRYALSLTHSPVEAEDLVQECFKRALAYRRSGHRIRNPRAYLFTILHNVHIDELARKQRVGGQVPFENVENSVTIPPDQLARLEWRDLARALSAMPNEQKQVMLMIGVDGLSYKSASEALGIPIGTVMSRLNRGRNALRDLLSDRCDELRAESNPANPSLERAVHANATTGTEVIPTRRARASNAALTVQ